MNLAPLVPIAQIVAPTVVAAGVAIGIVQLREFQRQRREVAAVELVNSFRNAEFNRALKIVWRLPEPLTAEALRQAGAEVEDAAIVIGTTCESVGLLVYREIVPLDMADELMGDAIVRFWKTLGPWTLALRREQRRESVFEWFQWLAERLEERERRTTEGAFVKHRDWRPTRRR